MENITTKKNIKILTIDLIIVLTIVVIALQSAFAYKEAGDTEDVTITGRVKTTIKSNGIGPVLDYLKDGVTAVMRVDNSNNPEQLNTIMTLDVTNISSPLSSKSFKYVVLTSTNETFTGCTSITDNSNCNIVGEGDFDGVTTGNKISVARAVTVNANSNLYYKFIAYIDGTMENNININSTSNVFEGVLTITNELTTCSNIKFDTGINKTGTSTITNLTNRTLGSSLDSSDWSSISPSDPEFLGWNTDKDAHEALNTINIKSCDMTIYAIYSKDYTINFKTYNNQTKTETKTIYNLESAPTFTFPKVSNTTNIKFVGWYTNSNKVPTTARVTTDTPNAGTYYALYKRNLTINYDANGGTGTTASQSIYTNMNYVGDTNNTSLSLASNAFTRTGYTFNKWLESDKTTVAAGAGESYTFNTDKTLYAGWTANGYTITYDLDGGTSGTKAPATATYDSTVQIDNASKKIEVSFDQNGTGATIGGSATSFTTKITRDYTFTGWTSSTTDGIDGNAKTGTTSNPTTTWDGSLTKNTYFKNLTSAVGGSVKLSANYTSPSITLPTLTKEGYTCQWEYQVYGEIRYKDPGVSYSPSSSGGSTTKTFKAVCTPNTPEVPTITGGSTSIYGSTDNTLTCTTTSTYESNTNKYYSFGYSTTANGTASNWTTASTTNTLTISNNEYVGTRYYYCKVYASNGTLTTSEVTSTGNTAVIRNNAKLTFDATTNGGTLTGTKDLYTYKGSNKVYTNINSTANEATIPTASKTDYEFIGWYDNSGNKVLNADGTFTGTAVSGYTTTNAWNNTANKTLYAHYRKQLTATFYYYDSSNPSNGTSTTVSNYLVNNATSVNITAPNALGTPTGYTFRGWATTEGANATIDKNAGATITLTANATYYASYSKSVTATFYYSTSTSDTLVYTNGAQSSKTASATQYLNYKNVIVNTNYTIPTEVSGSNGGSAAPTLLGYITSTTNAGVVGTIATVTPSTANTTYYTVYYEDVTFYYYNGTSHTNSNVRRYLVSNGTKYNTASNTNVPTPSNYDSTAFSHWSYDNTQYTSTYQREFLSTGVDKLYAVYPKTITATFNYYSGSAATNTQKSGTRYYVSKSGGINTYNNSIEIPSATTLTGYTFRGWSSNNAANASSTTFISSLDTTATTLTYYASYTYDITISYNGNGNTGGTAPTGETKTSYMSYNGTKSNQSFTLASNTYTKTGYSFSKWAEGSTSGTQYAKGTSRSINTSKTYYAIWDTNSYSITYDLDGGSSGTNAPASANYDTVVTIDNASKNIVSSFDENGSGATIGGAITSFSSTITNSYTFTGWTSSSTDGLDTTNAKTGTTNNPTTTWTGSLTTNTYFKNLSSSVGGSVKLSANYTAPTVTLPTLTKTGNTCHWESEVSGSTNEWASGGTYKPSNSGGASTRTFKAVCSPNEYTISYTMNSGTNYTGAPTSYFYGTGATIDGTPTRSGYKFNGWNNGSTTAFSQTIGTTETGNKTIEAKWCRNCATVAFGSCSLNASTAGTCTYTTSCNEGYTISNSGTYNPTCTINTYDITIAPGNGVASVAFKSDMPGSSDCEKKSDTVATCEYNGIIDSNSIAVTLKNGYSGYKWTKSSGQGRITSENIEGTGVAAIASKEFYVGAGTATITFDARSIVTPTPTVSIASTNKIYGSSSTALSASVSNTYDSGITVNYTYYYDNSSTGTYANTQTSTISSTSHYGTRYYKVKATATDGTLTSSVGTSTNNVSLKLKGATVTFDATTNGGLLSGTSLLYSKKGATSLYTTDTGSTEATIPIATKEDSTFNGWYDSATGGNKVLNVDGTFTGTAVSGYTTTTAWNMTSNKTLYAQYTDKLDNQLTLTYVDAVYTGNQIEANVTATSGGPVIIVYFTNNTCTAETGSAVGATISGTAPKSIGSYYVTAISAETDTYKAAFLECTPALHIRNANYRVTYHDNIRQVYDKDSQILKIGGRVYYKKNNGTALLGYTYNGTYTVPLLVSENASAVEFYSPDHSSCSILTADGSFTSGGKTYYYSDSGCWMQGQLTDELGLTNLKRYDNSSLEAAARALLADATVNATTSQTLQHGVATNLDSNPFTRTGYTFQGWTQTPTAYQGSSTTPFYTNGESVTNTTGNFDLYGVWKRNKITVTYDFADANNMTFWKRLYTNRIQTTYTSSSKMNNINVATDSGYEIIYMPISTLVGKNYTITFDYEVPSAYTALSGYSGIGYGVLSDTPTDSDNSTIMITGGNLPKTVSSSTITLNFTATTTTSYLVFNFGMAADGATINTKIGNVKIKESTFHNSMLHTLSTLTLNGATFNGWHASSSTGTVVSTTTKVTSNTTYYGGITSNTYQVSFNKNSGTGGQSSAVTATFGSSMPTISTSAPTRAGYTFQGWYDNADYTVGTQYYTASGTSARLFNKTSATTLYAGWKPNTIKIRYYGNGGTAKTVSDSRLTYNSSGNYFEFNESSYSEGYHNVRGDLFNVSSLFTKDYYHVEASTAWCIGTCSSTSQTVSQDPSNISVLFATDNVTINLYANWQTNKIRVAQNLNGGELGVHEIIESSGGRHVWFCTNSEGYYRQSTVSAADCQTTADDPANGNWLLRYDINNIYESGTSTPKKLNLTNLNGDYMRTYYSSSGSVQGVRDMSYQWYLVSSTGQKTYYNEDENYEYSSFCDLRTQSCDLVFYANWVKGTVVRHKPTSGETVAVGVNGNWRWTFNGSSGYYKAKKENVSTGEIDDEYLYVVIAQTGNSNSTINLANYNYSAFFNVSKSGYSVPAGSEWKCSGATNGSCVNTAYNHDTYYTSEQFCTISSGKNICIVDVQVNWQSGSTVTLNKQGGTGGDSTKTIPYNAASGSVTVTKPTKTENSVALGFGGYFTQAYGKGTEYFDTSGALSRTWNLTGNQTLYAAWRVYICKANIYVHCAPTTSADTSNGGCSYNTSWATKQSSNLKYYVDSVVTGAGSAKYIKLTEMPSDITHTYAQQHSDEFVYIKASCVSNTPGGSCNGTCS